jgi:hypothetical protein
MFVTEKLSYPFEGTTKIIDLAGRRLPILSQRRLDQLAFALELTALSDRDFIRVPIDLVREFAPEGSRHPHSICVRWTALNEPTFISCDELKIWPTAAATKLARWYQRRTSFPTWVQVEHAAKGGTETAHVLLHAPRCRAPASDDGPVLPFENVWLSPWSTVDRPHLWPRYELYGGAGGELILYTMSGLAHGHFKLAKRQLDAFRELEGTAPLYLGFYDPTQGIDAAYPLDSLTLPLPKNLDRAEPHYVIDVTKASRWIDQLRLTL